MTEEQLQDQQRLRDILKNIPAQIEALPEVQKLRKAEALAQAALKLLTDSCKHEKVPQADIEANHALHNLHWKPLTCPDCMKIL